MKMNLYFPNVVGIYVEPNALKLTARDSISKEAFVCAITDKQYLELRAALKGDYASAYEKIEEIVMATGIDVPMWLLAEPGIGDVNAT